MTQEQDRLISEAREAFAIAESSDPGREAYVTGTRKVVALAETGMKQADIAISVGQSYGTIKKLIRWHRADYKSSTPFTMDGATHRAEKSHARKLAREDPKAFAEAAASAPSETRAKVRDAINTQDDKEFFADENKARGHRKQRQNTMEVDARKASHQVLWKARARAEFYGDIPLNENETTVLAYAGQIIDSLLRGEQMDEGLREILDEEGIHAEE